MAYAFAGVRTQGLSSLTRSRSMAAVPFAGKFRLIDFTLSNCVNSELYRVAILAQYSPHSLIKHVGRGGPWDLNRRDGGVQIAQPYERLEGRRWYQGTADALRQNMDLLENSGADRVFVLSSELVYKMDYSWMLRDHEKAGARATIAVGIPSTGGAAHYGVVRIGEDGNAVDHDPDAPFDEHHRAFMGIYLFEAEYLRWLLSESDAPNLFLDLVRPRLSTPGEIHTHHFEGSWQGISTLADYLRANQRLVEEPPVPNLYDNDWRIYTRSEEMPTAWIAPGATVIDSLISNGAVIEGRVESSVLSPGVTVESGAVVRNCVLLNGTRVGSGAVLDRVVTDKHVQVGEGATVGGDAEPTGPITLLGKRSVIDAGATVDAGSDIPAKDLTLEAYAAAASPAGETGS